MGKDYYAILGVSASAPVPEIAKQFRVLALTYHPKRQQPEKIAQSNARLAEICEAYEVLSNAELRDIFDRYGEEMLKSGVPPEIPLEKATKKKPSVVKGGYRFSGNIDEIFEKFFGTSNPFTITLDALGNQVSALELVSKDAGIAKPDAPKDLEVTVPCTLEEFFFGCQKEIQFDKVERIDHRGNERIITIARIIEVKPGSGANPGTEEIRFPGEGNIRFA
jgi:DnaJ-class molecular chaperone